MKRHDVFIIIGEFEAGERWEYTAEVKGHIRVSGSADTEQGAFDKCVAIIGDGLGLRHPLSNWQMKLDI